MKKSTIDALKRLDAVDAEISAMPWLPTPWDVERFAPENADYSQLQVKKDAISRYAEKIIDKVNNQVG